MQKVSQVNKNLCFISKDIGELPKAYVRVDVCESLPADYQDEEGNHYCIFHYPNDNKHNETDFESVLKQKLNSGHSHFQYIYFSGGGVLSGRTFLSDVNFNHSTFTNDAYFMSSEFNGRASFVNAVFKEKADFNKAKFSQEADFSSAKFFEPAFFRETQFEQKFIASYATFSENVYFDSSIMKEDAEFAVASFEEYAYFFGTEFLKGADFVDATFKNKVFFSRTLFSESADFSKATFDEATQINFSHVIFKDKAYFTNAIIKGYLSFQGESGKPVFDGANAWLSLQNARIEKPERISFHTVRLQPNWFTNVDAKKFTFTDCRWKKPDGKRVDTKSELKTLKDSHNPNALLTKACRQIADNYEDSNGFEEASLFRQLAMESKRLENDFGFQFWTLHWWYWLSSFYGESWQRALVVLLVILFGFALIYTQTEFQTCPNNQTLAISITECKTEPENCKCKNIGLNIKEGITHSIATALFQNVEYRKPLTIWGELSTYLEKILAPLQAALLALAIRRKFMR